MAQPRPIPFEQCKNFWEMRTQLPLHVRIQILPEFLRLNAAGTPSSTAPVHIFVKGMRLPESNYPSDLIAQCRDLFKFEDIFNYLLACCAMSPIFYQFLTLYHTQHINLLAEAINTKDLSSAKELCLPGFNNLESLMTLLDLGFRSTVSAFKHAPDILGNLGPLITTYIQQTLLVPINHVFKDPAYSTFLTPLQPDFDQRWKSFTTSSNLLAREFQQMGKQYSNAPLGVEHFDSDLFGPDFESRFTDKTKFAEIKIADISMPIPFQPISKYEFPNSMDERKEYGLYLLKNRRITQLTRFQRILAAVALCYREHPTAEQQMVQNMFLSSLYEIGGLTKISINISTNNFLLIQTLFKKLPASVNRLDQQQNLTRKKNVYLAAALSSLVRCMFMKHHPDLFDASIFDNFGPLEADLRPALEKLSNSKGDIIKALKNVCALDGGDEQFVQLLIQHPDFRKIGYQQAAELGIKVSGQSAAASFFAKYATITKILLGTTLGAAGAFLIYKHFFSDNESSSSSSLKTAPKVSTTTPTSTSTSTSEPPAPESS